MSSLLSVARPIASRRVADARCFVDRRRPAGNGGGDNISPTALLITPPGPLPSPPRAMGPAPMADAFLDPSWPAGQQAFGNDASCSAVTGGINGSTGAACNHVHVFLCTTNSYCNVYSA